jgi:hypothetical protein
MNDDQKTITELKKRYALLEARVAALEDANGKPTPILGRASRTKPKMSKGMDEYWSGKKK